ncbi:MAG: hypothetical protein N2645_15335 [Clostridia bacterium]|nr:hypothetical protein [Clostridia bacterium]
MEIGILKKLSEKHGNALPFACAIVICLLLFSSVIMEYIRLTVISNGVRNALQAAVISVCTENYGKTYNGLREGYSGGYYMTKNGEWQENFDLGDIYGEIDNLLGLDDSHTKKSGSSMEYSLSGLSVSIHNAPFAPTDINRSNKFAADAKITLQVPFSFGWGTLPPIKMTIHTTATYAEKF